MKANPGGQIDVKSVVGRDLLIETLWKTAEEQSLLITAERRIGKTTVMKKMLKEPPSHWVPVYQDLENCHSAMEFALAVYKEIDGFLSTKKKIARRTKELFKALGGSEIGGFFKLPETTSAPWKDVLTQAIEDLMHENDEHSKLLFLWDEMPFMLMNIRNNEGEPMAMKVLDHLRWLRQTYELRMIITGSIGLHHVLSSLKEKNYSNSPVNDMLAIDVPPLLQADATELARLLIEGEGLECPEKIAAAATIAEEADFFPFYIQHIVKGLKISGLSATPKDVTTVVSAQLLDANDPWQLRHYRERITTYYPNEEKPVVLILDHLAVQAEAQSVAALYSALSAAHPFDDRERLIHILSLMERDHYLMRNPEGCYHFRFPLIRRWWKTNRGL